MEELGLSVERLNQLDPEQRLLALADAMSRMEDPAEGAGLAQRAFGTAVMTCCPVLMRGSDGIEQFRQRARDPGLTIEAQRGEPEDRPADAGVAQPREHERPGGPHRLHLATTQLLAAGEPGTAEAACENLQKG